MGSIQYFGFFCHGLLTSDPCTVETTEYVAVEGICPEMGHCVTPQREVRFRHLSCLGNTDVARDEDKDRGMNVKMDPVPDIVKHVDNNKGVSRKESTNVKYGSNENNYLHDGRGVKDNMNYVDEHDNSNHKEVREDMQKKRDTKLANSREQNSDMLRFLLCRNKQEIRKT